MGEYYAWVNVDKKEYMCPYDFDWGQKIHESAGVGNPLLGALYSLLASDWKNDHIVFLGDETRVSEADRNPVLQRLFAERKARGEPGCEYDYVEDTYKNVSGLFKAAEETVRNEIEIMIRNDDFDEYNYYRVDKEEPYKGLFVRESSFFQYTINHSKHEFFDVNKTKLTYTNEEGILTIRINPLPLLMAFPGGFDRCTGLWLGDLIEVTDNLPPTDYKDMSAEYFWG